MRSRHLLTATVIVCLLLLSVGNSLTAKTWKVPGDLPEITTAIDSSDTGDTVLVEDSDNYGYISLNKDILITVEAGETPVLEGSSTLSLGEVRGLTFRRLASGGSSYVIKTDPVYPGDVLLVDSTIEGESDTLGLDAMFYVPGANVTLRGCTIRNVEDVASSTPGSGGTMRFEECLILTENGPLLDFTTLEMVDCTMLSVYENEALGEFAFQVDGGRDAKIQRSIIGGFETMFAGCPSDTVEHNIFYNYTTFGCGSISTTDNMLDASDTNFPLFCDERETSVGKYTLRIDSPAVDVNNSYDVDIGRTDGVECAWGTLARTTEVEEDTEVIVLEDVTVPSTMTLTLDEGVTFRFDEDDDSEAGSDSLLNELTVEGTLDVLGVPSSRVQFISADTTGEEGDWRGLILGQGADASIDSADFKHAVEGILTLATVDDVLITNCTFEKNQLYDISAAGDNTADVTISDNTLTVGGGTGILISANTSTVSGNTVTGTSSSDVGIELEASTSNQTITDNTVKDFSTGSAILVSGTANKTPVIKKNTAKDSNVGIEVTTSKVEIGTDTGNDANTITGNTAGIKADGANAKPTIRYNTITGNSVGAAASGGAKPDLGTGNNDKGNNNITSNTSYCVSNRNAGGSPQVPAQYNWFGSGVCEETSICWFGDVDTGNPLCSSPFSVDWAMTRTPTEPKGLVLQGARPNPMTSGGKIYFTLEAGSVHLRAQVFDVTGRVVKDFGTMSVGPGDHHLHWDGKNTSGQRVRSGMYFVRVTDGHDISETAKVLVTR